MTVFTLDDNHGLSVDLLDYGARIVAAQFHGTHVACRYESIEAYSNDSMYLGASIGPIANRIHHGQFELSGKRIQMPTNEGQNTLHSGGKGFDKQIWQAVRQTTDTLVLKLDYDMTQAGMSGMLTTRAHYKVCNGTLSIRYESRCDQAAYLNLTNHVYLNLSGDDNTIDDHEFTLYADNFVTVDQNNIPTGAITSLAGPLDYAINRASDYPELQGQCDHHFNVGDARSQALRHLVSAHSTTSGICLDVFGNSPGFQFYTGASMNRPFAPSGGFCVETQYAPDAINQATFYAPLLLPGHQSIQTSEYRFHY